MKSAHVYTVALTWTGNKGEGTATYRAYDRNHVISAPGKPDLQGSSDPVFRGDKTRYNPEELLVAALSACHMLAYLHLCATHGIVVTGYTDAAEGKMQETPDGGGHFTGVTLRPVVTVLSSDMTDQANRLHEEAQHLCFIAQSVNFPVRHEPECRIQELPE